MSIKTFLKSLTSAIFIHHILPENIHPILILVLLENITTNKIRYEDERIAEN